MFQLPSPNRFEFKAFQRFGRPHFFWTPFKSGNTLNLVKPTLMIDLKYNIHVLKVRQGHKQKKEQLPERFVLIF